MRGDVRVASWSRSGTDARADGGDDRGVRNSNRGACGLSWRAIWSRSSRRYPSSMAERCSKSCAGCGLMGRHAVVESVRSELGGPAEWTLHIST